MKSLSNVFFNPASWARESMVFFITPFRQRESGWFPFPGMMMIVMLALCVFSAAVFAEPSVA
jgi:hypothetical protein